MRYAPIGLPNQLEDVLQGGPTNEQQAAVLEKIRITSRAIDSVIRINRVEVFLPEVRGADIFYFLKDPRKSPLYKEDMKLERPYYYPIQYAEIEFK